MTSTRAIISGAHTIDLYCAVLNNQGKRLCSEHIRAEIDTIATGFNLAFRWANVDYFEIDKGRQKAWQRYYIGEAFTQAQIVAGLADSLWETERQREMILHALRNQPTRTAVRTRSGSWHCLESGERVYAPDETLRLVANVPKSRTATQYICA